MSKSFELVQSDVEIGVLANTALTDSRVDGQEVLVWNR
jgi:hypothetical protein